MRGKGPGKMSKEAKCTFPPMREKRDGKILQMARNVKAFVAFKGREAKAPPSLSASGSGRSSHLATFGRSFRAD